MFYSLHTTSLIPSTTHSAVTSSGHRGLSHCNKHSNHEPFIPYTSAASMALCRREYLHVFSFCLVAVDTDSAHVTLLTHCAALSDVLCSSSSHRLQTSAEPAKPHLPEAPYKTTIQGIISFFKYTPNPHVSVLYPCLVWHLIDIIMQIERRKKRALQYTN